MSGNLHRDNAYIAVLPRADLDFHASSCSFSFAIIGATICTPSWAALALTVLRAFSDCCDLLINQIDQRFCPPQLHGAHEPVQYEPAPLRFQALPVPVLPTRRLKHTVVTSKVLVSHQPFTAKFRRTLTDGVRIHQRLVYRADFIQQVLQFLTLLLQAFAVFLLVIDTGAERAVQVIRFTCRGGRGLLKAIQCRVTRSSSLVFTRREIVAMSLLIPPSLYA